MDTIVRCQRPTLQFQVRPQRPWRQFWGKKERKKRKALWSRLGSEVTPRSHEIAEQRDAQHAERDEETKHPSFRIRRQHAKLPVKRMTLLERRRPLLFLLGLHIHSKFLDFMLSSPAFGSTRNDRFSALSHRGCLPEYRIIGNEISRLDNVVEIFAHR